MQEVRPFVLNLDRVGWWPRQRLLWAGTQSCPRELGILVSALAVALRAGGFSVERRPFLPHVTLLRDARRAPPQTAFGPVVWRAAGFVLAQSETLGRGVRYRAVAAWPPGMESPGDYNRR
jgi:2'-5' RNA ligase